MGILDSDMKYEELEVLGLDNDATGGKDVVPYLYL